MLDLLTGEGYSTEDAQEVINTNAEMVLMDYGTLFSASIIRDDYNDFSHFISIGDESGKRVQFLNEELKRRIEDISNKE